MPASEWRLPRFVAPSPTVVEAMGQEERRALLLQLTVLAQQVAAAQGTVAALLGVEADEPLWTAQEAARCLGVSADTVRTHGPSWGIEVDLLGADVHRYHPRLVRALRERRRSPTDAGTSSLTVVLPEDYTFRS
jgi:hypothetical protein